MDDALRDQAKARLEAILCRLEAASASSGLVIRHPPGTVEMDTGEYVTCQEVAEDIGLRLRRGGTVTLPSGDGWAISPAPVGGLIEALRGLAWLLGLSGMELSFVQSLAEKPGEAAGLCAFADWLGEQGREAEATRMRKAASQAMQGGLMANAG